MIVTIGTSTEAEPAEAIPTPNDQTTEESTPALGVIVALIAAALLAVRPK